jgi:hypothetical protein
MAIPPTTEQSRTCIRVLQMLSNAYRTIELFRFDDQVDIIYIFTGEDLQIVIFQNGVWRFL